MEENYELWFSISDGLFRVYDHLTVTILDVNDVVPSFDRKYYSFNVPENTKNRTVVSDLMIIIDLRLASITVDHR